MWGWRNRGYPSLGGGRPTWPPPSPTTPTPTPCSAPPSQPGCALPQPPPKWPVPCPPKPCAPSPPKPTPTPPGPTPTPPSAITRTRLVDLFYSEMPTGEVSYFFREARVGFNPSGRADDGTGTILSYRVQEAQTLVISDVEFYAQRPNPAVTGDQLSIEPRQLTGFVGLHVLVDDRSPLDLYTEIQLPPAEFPGTQPFLGSAFSWFGKVFGGADRQPHVFIRAREGQTLRLAYTVVNTPNVTVGDIGALVRGYVIPSAILTAKTAL
jgi:hypothetical protein